MKLTVASTYVIHVRLPETEAKALKPKPGATQAWAAASFLVTVARGRENMK